MLNVLLYKTKEVSNTKNINVNATRPPTNIPLGRQGENLATCVIFDCSGFAQLYGGGTAELLHELKDGTIYPVAVTQDGTSVSWIVTASDTATVGAGRAELRWYVGNTLAKSAKFRTSVSSALADSTTETPPEPQNSWVDKVLQAAQEIKDGAISDEKLAEAIAAYLEDHPIDAGLDEAALAAYLVENGYLKNTDLADAITQALAEAKASGQFDGAPGKDGANGGYYSPNVDNDGNLTWTASADNMPAVSGVNIKGPQGPQGDKGETGATGAQGPAGADGSPGADGADGVGIQSVEQTTTSTEDGGTNIVTVTKTDGSTSTFEVRNGSKGNDGAPGKDGANGADGQPGTSGKSAYQYAQEGGYTGTEAEFAAKLAEEMPDTLPNPNALIFTGAVTGSYDGSAPVSVDFPSGGGGETNFQLVFNQECLLDADVSKYEVDIDFGLQDFKEFIALVKYSASTNNVYQDKITFDGVIIESFGGQTAKGNTMIRVIYAKRITQTEYMGIHRFGTNSFDWSSGNSPSTLSYFGNWIYPPTGKCEIWRNNSAEDTAITIKLYKR